MLILQLVSTQNFKSKQLVTFLLHGYLFYCYFDYWLSNYGLLIRWSWEPKFTPSIFVIGGKSRNPNFPWSSGFSARANNKWRNKCRKYEKTTKQISRKSSFLFRICVRTLRLLQKIIKSSAARTVSEFPRD